MACDIDENPKAIPTHNFDLCGWREACSHKNLISPLSHLWNGFEDDVAILRFGVDVVYGAPFWVLDAFAHHQPACMNK